MTIVTILLFDLALAIGGGICLDFGATFTGWALVVSAIFGFVFAPFILDHLKYFGKTHG